MQHSKPKAPAQKEEFLLILVSTPARISGRQSSHLHFFASSRLILGWTQAAKGEVREENPKNGRGGRSVAGKELPRLLDEQLRLVVVHPVPGPRHIDQPVP